MLALLLSSIAVYATAQNSATVTNCATNSLFTLTDVSVTPTVPVKNENITVHTLYSVPVEITDGLVTYKCSFGGIPFSPTVDDLCTIQTCPITIGNYDEYSNVTVPAIGGKVVCDMIWTDTDKTVTYLCLRTTLKLSSSLRGILAYPLNMTTFLRKSVRPLPSNMSMALVLIGESSSTLPWSGVALEPLPPLDLILSRGERYNALVSLYEESVRNLSWKSNMSMALVVV